MDLGEGAGAAGASLEAPRLCGGLGTGSSRSTSAQRDIAVSAVLATVAGHGRQPSSPRLSPSAP